MVNIAYLRIYAYLLSIKYLKKKAVTIIILPEHIGDVIAFSPFAEKLKQENKANFIIWVIKPAYLSIIQFNKNIDYFVPATCDGLVEKFSKNTQFKIYDVRFNGNNYCEICDTKRIYNKIDNDFTLENYYEYGSLLEIFSTMAGKPMKKEAWLPTINIPDSISSEISKYKLPNRYIVIHTTSNDSAREWKNEKWIQLIQEIKQSKNLIIVQIGLENKLQKSKNSFIDLCGKLSLQQTAEVIKKCDLFIGIDSGPAHMANAVGAKSLILLGKYRQIANYMPFSGNFANGINSKIIYDKNIKCPDIEVETVFSAFNLLLKTQ